MRDSNYAKIKTNLQIQVLRGVFCIFIVLYHYTCRYSQIYNVEAYYCELFNILGDVALGSFLIISGYYFNNPNNRNDAKSFIGAKIYRLYPEYLVSITIIFLMSLTGYLGADREVGFVGYLLNIPMLNVVFRTGYVDGAHWYVTFLLLMTLYYAVIRSLNWGNKLVYWLVNAALCFIFCLVLFFMVPSFLGRIGNYARYYVLFSFGTTMRLAHLPSFKQQRLTFGFCMFIDLMSIFILKGFYYMILMLISIIIIELALSGKVSFLQRLPVFISIGNMSYLIYLLHQNIGYIIINYCRTKMGLPVIISILSAMTVVILLTITINRIMRIIINHKGIIV